MTKPLPGTAFRRCQLSQRRESIVENFEKGTPKGLGPLCEGAVAPKACLGECPNEQTTLPPTHLPIKV